MRFPPTDTEDLVVARVLASLCSLTELGLFTKPRLWELISNSYGFLCHPSPWIRQGEGIGSLCQLSSGLADRLLRSASAAFLSVAAKHLPPTDVWCIIYPYIRPLLRADVREMTELALLDVVKDPVRARTRLCMSISFADPLADWPQIKRSVLEAARTWASQSLRGPFWSTARTPRNSAKGRGVFRMTPQPSKTLPAMTSKVWVHRIHQTPCMLSQLRHFIVTWSISRCSGIAG
jgi:phosphoinositide-3-kinase regulatory subunit 4